MASPGRRVALTRREFGTLLRSLGTRGSPDARWAAPVLPGNPVRAAALPDGVALGVPPATRPAGPRACFETFATLR